MVLIAVCRATQRNIFQFICLGLCIIQIFHVAGYSLSTRSRPVNSRSKHTIHYNSSESPQASKMKLLLFGDSLTEGFYSHGMRFHPYSERLEELLYANFPDVNTTAISSAEEEERPVPFLLHERGVSGEFTDSMLSRLHGILTRTHETRYPYDIVCILGGTNDLSDPRNTPELIFGNLEQLYEQVFKHNSHAIVVAITIPQSFVKDKKYLETRAAVNNLIMTYQKHDKDGQAKVLHLDLEHAIQYYDSEGHVNRTMWDDGLHLTPNGYDVFGQLVFDTLKPVIPRYLGSHPHL